MENFGARLGEEDEEGEELEERGGWRSNEVILSLSERCDASDVKVDGETVSAKRKMPV